ncbi:hypothetical protein FB45DRAFT_1001500 [Roridomyces roridus]|uniref:Zn(2)-C6 fungal-type domain-containing protein n=1 Tax=Roridomyces roridus TaxID=1738132 RepID=A0AAD7C1D1_9AGAR|nr:hypothetical protein FB45DRAFT_1001500 [Roridomyces roridus]
MSNNSAQKNLHRGQACYNCRRRKMRCDGVRPVCGQCQRGNRPDDCEYVGEYTQSRVQILQENIARVEQRIYELEHPAEAPPPSTVPLHRPYTPGFGSSSSRGAPLYSPPENDIFRKKQRTSYGYGSNTTRPFPPIRQRLWILHPHPKFPSLSRETVPTGTRQAAHPSSAILRLSSGIHEQSCLARTLSLASTDLSSAHPHKALHTLQAEILLAFYFFSSGRFVEGKYHTASAAALALSSSLHLIRSANVHAPSVGQLPPPRDAVEEGERIHACWMTTILDNLWAAALKQEPARDLQSTSFDTPWPLELQDYEQGKMHPSARYSQTVQTFLTGAPENHRMSTLTGLARGSILWQQAEQLARSWHSSMPPPQVSAFQASFYALDAQIESFRTALGPPGTIPNPTPAMTRALIVAHSIGHAATVQLHSIEAVHAVMDSQRKRISSARAILNIVAETAPKQGTTVWMIACQAVMDEIRDSKIRSPQESTALASSLARAVSAMAVFVGTCPLLIVDRLNGCFFFKLTCFLRAITVAWQSESGVGGIRFVEPGDPES